MLSRYCTLVILIFSNLYTASCQGKGSLTFVIDNTKSMRNDIDHVKQNADAITKIAFEEKSSQIENMILITFNDPHAKLEIITENRDALHSSVNNISVHNAYGNWDCEEPSMTGILMGLDKSLPESYMYVFTDASAKDFWKSRDVKNLCQKKQTQITFVLTGHCYGINDPGFKVYYDIATACSGLAFYVNKKDVKRVLDMVKETLSGKKTVMKSVKIPPRQSTDIPFVIDDQTEYAIVTASGSSVTLSIQGPTAVQEAIMWLKNAKAIKLKRPVPGNYTATVKGHTETSVYIVGRTDFLFSHGFSVLEPNSLNDTSPQPIVNTLTHLSIAVTDPKHTVNIISAQILDMAERPQGKALPLTRVSGDFYITAPFLAPSKRFKVAVNAAAVSDGKHITRIAKIPVTPQEPPPPKSKKPVVTISEGSRVEVEYGTTIRLTCKVSAYPEPSISWSSGVKTRLDSQSSVVELPYKYISYLTKTDVTKSAVYSCRAANSKGAASNTIELIVKDPFKVKTPLQGTSKLQYGVPGTLTCDIQASVPIHIVWSYTDTTGASKMLVTSDKYTVSADGKQLQIKRMDLDIVGTYSCKATVDRDSNKFVELRTRVELGGLVLPAITGANTKTERKGSNVVIECHVSGVPKPTVSWQFMAADALKFVSVAGSDNVLRISNVDEKHAGRYKCVAHNVAGDAQHETTLTIQVPPQISGVAVETKLKGSHVAIECRVSGLPKPTISWQFMATDTSKFVSVAGSDSVLRISSVDEKHAGRYKCVAHNVAGDADHVTTLTILAPPQISGSTVETKLKSSNVAIECSVSGVPRPTISWQFMAADALKFVSVAGSDSVLRISSVDEKHAGRYKCVAHNVAGDTEHVTTLNVQVPPQIKGVAVETKLKGSVVAIECRVSGVPKPTISWQFMAADTSKFVSVAGSESVLRISSVDEQHAGRYKCVAHNVAGDADHVTTLTVLVPPQISGSTVETKLKSSNVAIECRVSGVPRPTISWQFMAADALKFVSVAGSNSVLRISSVDEKHAGRYKCVAHNVAGDTEHVTTLNVQVPPQIKGVAVETKLKGSVVAIVCRVSGVPKPTISWQFMAADTSKFVSVAGSESVLRISSVDEKHAGRYKCVAHNVAGDADHVTTLTVLVPPQISGVAVETKLKGSNVAIECRVSGVPRPTISWQFMGANASKFVSVEGSDSVLRISSVDEKHAGRYKCVAHNVAGDAQHETTFTVLVPPKVTGVSDKTIVKGSKVAIECTAYGLPQPLINWQFMGKDDSKFVLLPGTKNRIRISTVDEKHAGRYKCIAHNVAGHAEHVTTLIVQVPPAITTAVSGIYTSVENSDAKLEIPCSAIGFPTPVITWKVNGVPITQNKKYSIERDGTLVINNPKVADSATYRCEATNDAGSINVTFQANVYQAPKSAKDTTKTAITGSSLNIECTIGYGVPKPTISWHFMAADASKFVSVAGSDNVLRISSVDEKHAGRYKCVAHNVAGDAQHETTLIVQVPPKLMSNTPDVAISVEGRDVLLKIPCVVTGLPKPKITWEINGVMIAPSDKYFIEDGALVINNPKVSDSATYMCKATNDAGSVTTTIQAKVFQEPKVSGATTKTATVGFAATIECTIGYGVPKPTISWLFKAKDESKYVSLPVSDTVLPLWNVDEKHAGSYKCVAHNVAGEAQHETSLTVQAPPKIIASSSTTYKSVEDKDAQLRIPCSVTGLPTPTITWKVNDVTISASEKYFIEDGALVINNPKVSDSATYRCEATNDAGSVDATFQVNVLQAPKLSGDIVKTAVEGASVQIECKLIKGVPAPAISWEFRGKTDLEFSPVPESTNVLHIPDVESLYTGSYKCIAHNEAGTAEHVTTLIVQYVPVIKSKETQKYVGLEGDRVLRIPCDTVGVPPPTVTWIADGTVITPNVHYSVVDGALVIKDPKPGDSKSYICQVKNALGTTQATFDVNVYSHLDDYGTIKNVSILLGTTKKLDCGADESTQSIRWFREGTEVNWSKNYYTIENADLPSEGNYSCRVSDLKGAHTNTFAVEIGYAPHFSFEQESTLFDWRGTDSENDKLDCLENSKPPADIEWTYNGKVLHEQRSSMLSVSGNWGYYTCKVSNVHGSLQKSFNVTSSRCLIKRRPKDSLTMPLILNLDSTWPVLDSSDNYLEVSSGQSIIFSCPSQTGAINALQNFPTVHEIIAICDKEDIFTVDGKPYKVSDFHCAHKIDSIVIKKQDKCLNENSELIRVGYNVHGFLGTYGVCFDTSKNIPLYTRVLMSKSNRGRNVAYNWYKVPEIATGIFNRAYTCADETSSCCYGKIQLVNAHDVSDGPAQKSTFIDSLNSVPYWRPCVGTKDPWDKIDTRVRSQLDVYSEFVTWSGIHKLQEKNGQTVPRYLWKVLQFEDDDPLAVVYINDPLPSKEDVLCPNFCVGDNVPWLSDLDERTYCCEVKHFLRAFELSSSPIANEIEDASAEGHLRYKSK